MLLRVGENVVVVLGWEGEGDFAGVIGIFVASWSWDVQLVEKQDGAGL